MCAEPAPTDEQREAVDKFKRGTPLKIAAFAGAGKTTTLRLLAQSRSSRGVYLAFNKAIATEARQKFPRSVDCRTTHAMAFRAVMPAYQSTAKLTRSTSPRQIAEVMGLRSEVFADALRLESVHQAHLILSTVRRFCQSADDELSLKHFPAYGRLLGAKASTVAEVRTWALDTSRLLWKRMQDRRDDVPLGHDGYLKLWALGHPKIAAEYILLDEAQDTNPVVLGVLREQQAQIVYVGDRHQQIYEWRGAVNAMETIEGCEETALTQSFRFGPAIANAASAVLATLGEHRAIRGNPAVKSSIVSEGVPTTILARTNATVVLQVLQAMNANRKPFVVGGTEEVKRLLGDVYELKKGKSALSPEFFGFTNWKDVVEFSQTEEGESLRMFVQLVEEHGESKLWAAMKGAHDEEASADLIVSTAHKAKGREWDAVSLAPDFSNVPLGPAAAAEVRLFYVAMTRARHSLIVIPEVLETFRTDAWKKARTETPTARSGAAPNSRNSQGAGARAPRDAPPPQTRPRPSFDRPTREDVRGPHPGAPRTTPANEPLPQGQGPWGGRSGGVEEVTPPSVRERHPGAPEAKPQGLWSRIVRSLRG